MASYRVVVTAIPCWPYSPGDVLRVGEHLGGNVFEVERVRRAAGPEPIDQKTGLPVMAKGKLHWWLSIEPHTKPMAIDGGKA